MSSTDTGKAAASPMHLEAEHYFEVALLGAKILLFASVLVFTVIHEGNAAIRAKRKYQ